MRQCGRSVGSEFGDDCLREFLAQLDAPLIERVDSPHRALHERFVFIGGGSFSVIIGLYWVSLL